MAKNESGQGETPALLCSEPMSGSRLVSDFRARQLSDLGTPYCVTASSCIRLPVVYAAHPEQIESRQEGRLITLDGFGQLGSLRSAALQAGVCTSA